jgi:4-hydroxy-2-oxoglutarate aldolase
MSKGLSGIFPPVTTPFDAGGELLIEEFRTNCERWAKHDLAGLTVLGSNGESPFLSDHEKLLLVREARARIAADKTMVVGAGRESTRLCLEFIRKVTDLGADYALVGTPCYFKARMTDDALFAHFWTVADKSSIPILLYNVPQFTGVNMSASLITRLSAHENIAGIKESSANIALQAEVRRRAPQRFKLLVGSAPTLLASMIHGACGGIVAIACALPKLTVDLYLAFASGHWKLAAELQERLSPPAAAVTTMFGVPGLKAAMNLTGFHGGEPRLPLLPLGSREREVLCSIFRAAGVCEAPVQQDRGW